MILWIKPKYFEIIFDEDQCSPSLPKAAAKEEQILSQEKKEELDKICENYVIC
jgi:hypothetical protein